MVQEDNSLSSWSQKVMKLFGLGTFSLQLGTFSLTCCFRSGMPELDNKDADVLSYKTDWESLSFCTRQQPTTCLFPLDVWKLGEQKLSGYRTCFSTQYKKDYECTVHQFEGFRSVLSYAKLAWTFTNNIKVHGKFMLTQLSEPQSRQNACWILVHAHPLD